MVWDALGTPHTELDVLEPCLGRERALSEQCPSWCVPVTSLER